MLLSAGQREVSAQEVMQSPAGKTPAPEVFAWKKSCSEGANQPIFLRKRTPHCQFRQGKQNDDC